VGAFLFLSTTVHPWYLLGILPFALVAGTDAAPGFRAARRVVRKTPARDTPSWPWVWLSVASIGTYLLYTGGPYWPWVAAGWGGAALLGARAVWRKGGSTTGDVILCWVDRALQAAQRRRADRKVDRLAPYLRTAFEASDHGRSGRPRVLDLGAGEGYVGRAVERRYRARVQLCDLIDLCRVDLPHDRYDGRTLPYPDDTFDATVLYFVLHHAEDPERVLSEALRVTRGRVIVVESVVTGPLQHRALHAADRLANRLRSANTMRPQEEHLDFRPTDDWIQAAHSLGAHVDTVSEFPGLVHPQALLSIRDGRG
jgi:SAM-dependent methyltransferase